MAKLLFSQPSSLDKSAMVEVKERPGGWYTLGIAGGATKSIYHGIYKLKTDENGQRVAEHSVLVAEHLRTMASVATTFLESYKKDRIFLHDHFLFLATNKFLVLSRYTSELDIESSIINRWLLHPRVSPFNLVA